MLRKLKIFIIIIISTFLILSPISYSSFTPDVVELYNGKVMIYSEVSAFKLILANGQTISGSALEGDSEQVVTEFNGSVQLVLVIDVSGSMGGGAESKMEKAKSAAKSLVQNLMGIGGNIEIALVSFESTAKTVVNLTNSEQQIISGIDGLSALGGTVMAPAIDLANEILEDGKTSYESANNSGETENSESDLHQYCVILTDGVTENPDTCYDSLVNMDSKQIGIYGVLLESNDLSAFQRDNVTVGNVYPNVSSQELLEIYEEIFDEIHNELVENVIPDFEFSEGQGFVALDTGVFVTIDKELIQGAQLYVEYVINIKSSMDINKIEIEDFTGGNIVYDQNMKMLTEDKTNADYGWSFIDKSTLSTSNENMLYLEEESNSTPVIEKRGSLQKKIIYSKILSTSDDENFEHYTVVRLNGDSENGMASLDSLPVIIVPPFGDNHNNTLIVLIIIILAIITYVIIKKRLCRR